MMRSSIVCHAVWLAALFAATSASAQVRVTNAGGKTLNDLVGTDTYVTVVLKPIGSLPAGRDMNMRVRDVGDNYVAFKDVNDQPTSHPFANINEIRVQSGIVDEGPPVTGGGRLGRLSADDRSIEERAIARAFEVFETNRDKGELLMRAAAVMAATNGPNRTGATTFLSSRAESNNVPTSVAASLAAYIAGYEPDEEVIGRGLYAGVRTTKGQAALLAGLAGEAQFEGEVHRFLGDPSPEIFPPAAIAAALLGDRAAVPRLIDAMTGLDETKAAAAVRALSMLGGDEVRAEMRRIVEMERGLDRFRALTVLFNLGDPQAAEQLKPSKLREPLVEVKAAIMLTRKGDWDANLWLRDALDSRKDPNRENLTERARVAAALYDAGHVPAKGELQDLLRLSSDQIYARGHEDDDAYKEQAVVDVKVAVCNEIAKSGNRALMSLLQPVIEAESPEVAMAAVEAAVALANPQLRERLLLVRSVS